MRAWASLKRLEEAGRGSAVSHALESQVLNNLCLSDGGFPYGSAEHTEMLERIKALGALATSDVELQMSADANTGPSKEAMEAEVGLYFAALFAIFALEGISAYSPMTQEMLVQSHHHMRECVKHDARAAALAPDPAAALAVWSYITAAVYMPRQHALAEFAPESLLGRRGARLHRPRLRLGQRRPLVRGAALRGGARRRRIRRRSATPSSLTPLSALQSASRFTSIIWAQCFAVSVGSKSGSKTSPHSIWKGFSPTSSSKMVTPSA